MIVNNSENKPNWSQRNNQFEPLSTCNVTACINAAQAAGYDVEYHRHGFAERPADDLLKLIQASPTCNQLWASLDPNGTIPINRWMAVLALGLSEWLGTPGAASFEMTTWEKMRDCILLGGACVVSGEYPTLKLPIGHITALVGLETDSLGRVVEWIMDDSYGDYRTKYVSRMGNDTRMPHSDFEALVKECGLDRKRCVFVPKKGVHV